MNQLYIVQKCIGNGDFINTLFLKQYSLARRFVQRYIKKENLISFGKQLKSGIGKLSEFKEISPDVWTNGFETLRIITMKFKE